jgi:hypothetical protein
MMTTIPDLFGLSADKLRPMTTSESEMFLRLVLGGVTDDVLPLDFFDTELGDPETLPFVLRVIVERLRPTGLSYSPRAILFAASLCDRPGTAVLWAYALFKASRDGSPKTLSDLTAAPDAIFATGVPTEDALRALWEAQKDRNAPLSNSLDAAETWAIGDSVSA